MSTDYGTDYGTGGSGQADPDEIRRDIERTQANLRGDVDALTEKVTPGRVVERRVARVRSSAARLKDRVMGSETSGPGMGGGARGTAHQVAGSVSGTASSAASGVSDAASSAASGVSDAASTVAGAVAEAPQVARRQAQGNPLAAGLIAFGAGWLVSSLLPATRREQELAGEAKDRAAELGRPVAEAARQAATEVKDNLAGPAQEAVESVRSTATDAGRTVADEGRSAAERVQGQAQESAGTVRQQGPG
jgi:hypothetical protein